MLHWINVVSLDHVRRGIEESITQACHGKKGPLTRMKKGDWIIHYSPKLSMSSTIKCQKFTSIGQIADDEVYQFDMGEGFVPFRRKVKYLQDIQEAPIEPLLDQLSFTKGRKSWGFMFRFGLFKVQEEDFRLIYNKMVGKQYE